MTNKLEVSVDVNAEFSNTRTFAVACEQILNVDEYENQMVVQQFVQARMDNPVYRLSVVELSPPQQTNLLQVFSTFDDDTRYAVTDGATYTVYFVTFQSIDANNPTIKVVSKTA